MEEHEGASKTKRTVQRGGDVKGSRGRQDELRPDPLALNAKIRVWGCIG